MCEFHGSNSKVSGDIWWTDNPINFSSIDIESNHENIALVKMGITGMSDDLTHE